MVSLSAPHQRFIGSVEFLQLFRGFFLQTGIFLVLVRMPDGYQVSVGLPNLFLVRIFVNFQRGIALLQVHGKFSWSNNIVLLDHENSRKNKNKANSHHKDTKNYLTELSGGYAALIIPITR